MNDYEDIINLPHWEPRNHPRMSLANRASQFAPFAALVGHDAAIQETARLTDDIIELDIQAADLLDEKINLLIKNINVKPEITVTYFVKDIKKSGGVYTVYTGTVRLVDESVPSIIFTDGVEIPVPLIKDISGALFKDIDGRI